MKLDLEDPRLALAAEWGRLHLPAVRYVYAVVAGCVRDVSLTPGLPAPILIIEALAVASVWSYGLAAPAVLREEGIGTARAVGRHLGVLVYVGLFTAGPRDVCAYDGDAASRLYDFNVERQMHAYVEAIRPKGRGRALLCR